MKRVRFPKRIKRGSCVVTIYRTPTNGYAAFTIVHYDAKGTRCRRSFADYKLARAAATEVANKLSEGKSAMLVLTRQALLVYRRAMKVLRPTRTSLDTPAVRFAEMTHRNNGDSEVNATGPVQQPAQPTQQKLVAEVLKELLKEKAEKGRSHLYLTDLRVRLTRFAAGNLPERGQKYFAIGIKRDDALVIGTLRFVQPAGFHQSAQNQIGLAGECGGFRQRESRRPSQIQDVSAILRPQRPPLHSASGSHLKTTRFPEHPRCPGKLTRSGSIERRKNPGAAL
jgi:hypothetical protein